MSVALLLGVAVLQQIPRVFTFSLTRQFCSVGIAACVVTPGYAACSKSTAGIGAGSREQN